MMVLEYLGLKNPNISSTSYIQAALQGDQPINPTTSGSYLSSRAAQHRNDWARAADFLEQALRLAEQGPVKIATSLDEVALKPPFLTQDDASKNAENKDEARQAEETAEQNRLKAVSELRQRILIFNLGAGEFESALKYAKSLENVQDATEYVDSLGIAHSVMIVDAFREANYDRVDDLLKDFSYGAVSQSLKPLFETWRDVYRLKEAVDVKPLDLKGRELTPLHEIYAYEFFGDIERAKKLMIALDRKADNAATRLALAVFYARNEMQDEAKAVLSEMITLHPDDDDILDLHAVLNNGGDLTQNPTYATLSAHMRNIPAALAVSLYDMAISHYANANVETALLLAQMAHVLADDIAQVNFLLAEILTDRDNYDAALSVLGKITKDHFEYSEAAISRAEIFVEMDDFDAAFKELSTALELTKDYNVAFHLGDLYRQQERYQEALDAYNRVQELAGGDVPDRLWSLYYYRGIVYHELDQWDDAEKQLLKAKELRPNNPYVLNYIGYSWAEKGKNVEEALEILHKALEQEPNSGYITDSVGWAYFKLGRYDRATIYLERAAELMPYDPEVIDHLGDLYWKTGRKLEAYYQWKRVLDYGDADDERDQEIMEAARKKLEAGL